MSSTDKSHDLFAATTLGDIPLRNRIVMAPMTRSRAEGNLPNALIAEYYGQRAEAGLIITEGTAPSPNGLGYARIPGLFSQAHVDGWRLTTDAVHRAGSKIFVQLMHTGRVSHPANLPAGARVLAPSAIAWDSKMWVDGQGQLPVPTAEAMTEADIETAIGEFVQSAQLAIDAGFDGIELHGANGYLIEQFLNTAANQRTDRWGGSVENRLRFASEVMRRTAAKIGGARVGIRVSPFSVNGGLRPDDDGAMELHTQLATAANAFGLAYVHVVDHSSMGAPPVPAEVKARIRQAFAGTVILAGGYDLTRAQADLAEGRADLIAFARPFISNPRLPTLLRNGGTLVAPDMAAFFSPGPAGYTDYPVVG